MARRAPPNGRAVILDGKLDEWERSQVPAFTLIDWRQGASRGRTQGRRGAYRSGGVDDFCASHWVRWTKEGLSIAGEVIDDKVVFAPALDAPQPGDRIVYSLDPALATDPGRHTLGDAGVLIIVGPALGDPFGFGQLILDP